MQEVTCVFAFSLNRLKKFMRIHLVAIGGSVMHNLAMDLALAGHHVSGSDDEFYEPSRSRLKDAGLLPGVQGWDPDRIDRSLDCVIAGMHARRDNPEIAKAQELGIRIYSFPEFYGAHCRDKTRIVIAGSHGKTTTTGMLMHVLKRYERDFDYLVGASLEGFERNVRLTQAPVCVIEGDEYPSSPLDPRPKIMHYDPDIAVITGIAWDHMNVFPTWEVYVDVFRAFISGMRQGAMLIWYAGDDTLARLVAECGGHLRAIAYRGIGEDENHHAPVHMQSFTATQSADASGAQYALKIFGRHNMQNLSAAALVSAELGISLAETLNAMQDFNGAAMRLQELYRDQRVVVYRDFAHAPSKVRATVQAVREKYPSHQVVSCLELHTYSSLNKDFLPQYASSMDAADHAIVFYSPKTLEHKKLPSLSVTDITTAFAHHSLEVATAVNTLKERLAFFTRAAVPTVLLLMSSGRFEGMDIGSILDVQSVADVS